MMKEKTTFIKTPSPVRKSCRDCLENFVSKEFTF
jgi:hypothetical protein